jgi:hypothetical protein
MDESIVEGGENMGNAKDKLAFTDLWSEGNSFLRNGLLGSSLGLSYAMSIRW